jgi:hypothetical protein
LRKALPNCNVVYEAPADPKADSGFVPLFNRQYLTSWKPIGGAKRSCVDGRVAGHSGDTADRQVPSDPSQHRDFELELHTASPPVPASWVTFQLLR